MSVRVYLFLCCPVQVAAFDRANHSSKESYRLSIKSGKQARR
jgi:hypothetical protein